MITAILIANRGEIACRIIRTCRRLGLRTVAVYSAADAQARHVQLADEAVYLGPAPAIDSYLNVEAVLTAADRAGAGAIHPGYGFLAENAEFARACAAAGLIFIGPSAGAIETMGDKRAARELVAQAGVPLLSGYSGSEQSDGVLQREAERLGFPLMVKAAAGGGGKGMRLVPGSAQLAEALAAARREASQAFGSAELMLERALARPRHVEFQVLGDRHGHLIHLNERECSIQRRHQKIVEETPSPALTPALRQQMGEAAVAAARAVNYDNAGTVEFLLDDAGHFYFLEMNTRLQVEHPITEAVTDLDLVEWQIRLAEGEALPLRQEDVTMRGHAIEARLYAENPANDFLPATGPILLWQAPAAEGVRVDSGIDTGDHISIYYDPLLAKIIAHAPDRITAVRRLARALETTVLLGLTHNLAFLIDLLRQPAFQAGNLHTAFIETNMPDWRPADGDPALALLAVTVAQWLRQPQAATNAGYWRNNPNRPQRFRYRLPHQDEPAEVQLTPGHAGHYYHMSLSSRPEQVFAVELNSQTDCELVLTIDGHRQRVILAPAGPPADGQTWWVHTRAGLIALEALSLLPQPAPAADAGGSLRAPMPGAVLAVLVEVGQLVSKGQALMKLEAMKMEHTIRTAADGVVEAIHYGPGDMVEADAQLLTIRP